MLIKLKNYIALYILIQLSGLMAGACYAQKVSDPILAGYVHAINGISKDLPIEKLYLQTDKSDYISGDTLHFKAYLLDADYLTGSTRSGLLYIELDNLSNKSVKRIVTAVKMGISYGDIPLDEKDIDQGNYTLRAYTNWMQNFGNDYVFKKNISVSGSTGNTATLVKTAFKLDTSENQSKLRATLKFVSYNSPVALKDVKLLVHNGSHIQMRERTTTGIDGSVELNIPLKEKTLPANLSIVARYPGRNVDTTELTIPVNLSRPEKTDVQFLPEGGNLVAGLPAKVAVKALGEDGKGVDVTGKITDANGLEVTSFKTTYAGMGTFSFTPKAGKRYTAKVNLPNGKYKSFSLPKVDTVGTTISVVLKGKDSLMVTVNATPKLSNQRFYLIAQARGVICYAAAKSLKNGPLQEVIARTNFPTGIIRFTLLNALNQPLNERLYFNNLNDDLKIKLVPDRPVYASRDSVALNIIVTDKNNKPVQGTFSIAVTDDDQVKTTAFDSNLLNSLLFTDDLKGDIENPGYYFADNSRQRAEALDNLMLTQGWVGYNWKDVFNTKRTAPKFRAEQEFDVRGKVTNIFNKPVKKTEVVLLRKSPFLVIDTLTDDNGEFNFNGDRLLSADSAAFMVEAKNKNGRNFNVGVDVEEFTPADFTDLKNKFTPWYVNSDSTLLSNNKLKQAQTQSEADYRGEGKQLKEVKIKEIRTIAGSKNPNPEWNTLVWDQKDMDNANNSTLGEMLVNKYNMFKHVRYASNGEDYSVYTIKGTYFVKLNIDGWWQKPPQQFLDYLNAKDIKGIEIQLVFRPDPECPLCYPHDFAFIYVTTHSGNGAFLKHTPGVYTFKPIPFSVPKIFYRPRYTAQNKNKNIGTDLRSTIHWEPNLITDKDGKGTITFFTADKPATYTAIIEGTDLNGNLGSQRITINAKPKQTP